MVIIEIVKILLYLKYKTLIQCHLDYCDGVWSNTGKGYIEQLSLSQKRALKIVLMVNRRYPTEQLFCQLRIDRVLLAETTM